MDHQNSRPHKSAKVESPNSIWRLRESTQKKDPPKPRSQYSKTEGIHQPFVTAAEYHSKQAQKFINAQKAEKPKTSSARATAQVPRKVVQHDTRSGPLSFTTPEREEQLRNMQWSAVKKSSSWNRNLNVKKLRSLGRTRAKRYKLTLTVKRLPSLSGLLKVERTRLSNFRLSMSKMQVAFVAAGLIVFAGGVTVTIMGLKTNREVAAQAQNVQQSDNSNPDMPDEGNQPDDNTVGRHKVAPDEPRRILIPKLKVNSRIFGMGVKADNQLDTPKNIYDTGWYRASAKPGEQGAMLIDGHVSGPTRPGVFAGIKKLSKGDTITVERGDGKIFNYEVVNTKEYDASNTDMLAAVTPVVPGKQGLNLITCSGKFDSKTSQYVNRTIVFTTLID